MQTYSLSKQGIAKYRSQLTWLLIVAGGIAIIATSIFTLWISHGSEVLIVVGASMVLWPLLMVYFVRQGLRLYKAVWESIRIEVGDDHVTRSQLQLSDPGKGPAQTDSLRLSRSEVVVIEEAKSGLLVRTRDKARTLVVPAALDEADYQAVKQKLGAWVPVRPWLPRRRIF